MKLWTDLIDPETLTQFARRALEEYEAAKGSLAAFLPNTEVDDISVRFVVGQAGLVPEARYRAFDAEPEFGKGPTGKRVTIDLVSLSQQGIISERDQLRLRKASDEIREKILLDATRMAVQGIAARSERQRGTVLVTGQATITQDNYVDSADFGRDPSMNVVAPDLWTDPSVDRLSYLVTLAEQYRTMNGDGPGAILASGRVARALSDGDQFATLLANGATRRATRGDAYRFLESEDLPPITINDRRTSGGRIIPDDVLLLLPAPVDPNGGESGLGATFWGQTLAASEPDYEIQESEQPGVVAAAFTNEGIPPIRHTYVDSLSLPVLANANLSMVAKVL